LLARVQDTNQSVIEALYNEPKVILPMLTKHASTYLTNLSTSLFMPGTKPKRALLRAHLNFLGMHLFPADFPCLDDVFHQIMYPFLLFSKPRQHTAELAWETISSYLQEVDVKKAAAYEWVGGCASIINSEQQNEGVDAVERMSSLNMAIADRIASGWLLLSIHVSA
jgi:U3 small nucleolar RNA-associated protein 10